MRSFTGFIIIHSFLLPSFIRCENRGYELPVEFESNLEREPYVFKLMLPIRKTTVIKPRRHPSFTIIKLHQNVDGCIRQCCYS